MGKLTRSASVSIKEAGVVGEKTVRAVVTAPTLDRDGDIIDTNSLHMPLKGGGWVYASELVGSEEIDIPFLLDHNFTVEGVIGSVRSAYINPLGELEVVFGVSSRSKAQDMFTLLDEGHLNNAFSITISYGYDNVSDNMIFDGEVIEISLVFKGSNRNARLLEVSKSLLKGEIMATAKKSPELTAKREQLAKLQQEIEADEKALAETEASKEVVADAEVEEVETEESVPAKNDESETDEEDTPEESEEATAEADEEEVEVPTVPKPEVPTEAPIKEAKVTSKDEEKTMTEQSSKDAATASAGVKTKEVEQPRVEVKADKNAHKLLAYKQIVALKNHDYAKLAELNAQAKEMDRANGVSSKAIKSKEIGYSDAEPLYLVEQLSKDIEECRGDFGSLSSLVTTINLTTSPKMRIPTVEGSTSFVPVGWEGEKPEDSVTFGDVSLEPKPFAFIQVWSDHAAEDSQIALYDLMVRNVAEADAELDDKLILDFAGVTADSLVYPDQGILQLIDSSRVFEYTTSDGEDMYAKLLAAVGAVRSCDRGNVRFAMNNTKLFELAGLRNSNGELIFSGSGLNLGIAGTYQFVTSDVIPSTDIVVGNFRRLYLGKKEGLSLTTNNLGIVGEKNLYTTDKTALRAVVRRESAISDASLDGAFAVVRGGESS